eukprot:TRINITY_DN6447_c0_g1_i1.p1 TRINITY_DN6447_c0_g1~~TRINITY_DN6447_c0_g1_i1.p1  ORF type:complete len:308 (+),score=52.36 TRINITY_DN6447_c0_g1_i1:260-1183(+)
MDCSVRPHKKYKDYMLISTTDFFYPLIHDPYIQGRIAACNVLSDMYAMGVVDIDNVLMILAASRDMQPKDCEIVTKEMIRGFSDLCDEADTSVTGGQTIYNPWPIIGGVAQSICKKEDFIMPNKAVAGDVIVLTKWLGTQIAVNIKQWMGNKERWTSFLDSKLLSVDDANRAFQLATLSMARLNRVACQLMHKHGAHAATDVTGFGLLGHARNLASNQKTDVSFVIHTLPIIRGMKAVDEQFKSFKLMKGLSAETSGGLFVCLPKKEAEAFVKEIEEIEGFPAWIIGDVVSGDRQASLAEKLEVIEI